MGSICSSNSAVNTVSENYRPGRRIPDTPDIPIYTPPPRQPAASLQNQAHQRGGEDGHSSQGGGLGSGCGGGWSAGRSVGGRAFDRPKNRELGCQPIITEPPHHGNNQSRSGLRIIRIKPIGGEPSSVEIEEARRLLKMRYIVGYTRTKEECCLTGDDDNTLWRAKMPCSHAFCAEAVYEVMKVTLGQKSLIFTCPATKANGEECAYCWDYTLVREVACLTPKETKWADETINHIDMTCSAKAQSCPNCKIFCLNQQNRKRAQCGKCKFEFCWSCQLKWHNSGDNNRCGNDICSGVDQRLSYLKKETGKKTMGYTGIEAYDTRACPHCGFIIHHKGGCKQTKCPSCQIDFCFVCLSIYNKQTSVWPCGSYSAKCTLAPIQSKIPEKSK